jgi:HD-like signal output (HDOD) protein
MIRTLFVDDHAEVLNGYRESLENTADIHTFLAQGSEAAIKALQTMSIDVLVVDTRLRGIEAPKLLRIAKDKYPNIVRLMLCPQYEMQSTLFTLSVAHQVLSKPLDTTVLVNAIERSRRLHELLTDSLRKKIGGLEHLPPTPAAYLELIDAMDRSDASNLKIAAIIEKDAAMAAKTLQLVNSACFGILKHVTKLESAVAYLGMDVIRGLSLTMHLVSALESTAIRAGFSFEAEQEHSVVTAKVARRLLSSPREAQDAFTAGLLHDVGKLVLAVCIPERFTEAQRVCAVTGRLPHEVESELLGVTHAEAGAYLLGLWGIPYSIVEAVAYHHNPSAALERTFDVPSAVSLANAVVESITDNRPIHIADHLESLGVMRELPAILAMAGEELERTAPETAVVQ